MMYISGVTYYISSTINPILYNVMSAKYRQDTVIVYYAYEIPVHGRSQENPITHFFYNTTTILFWKIYVSQSAATVHTSLTAGTD